jgi:ethanolamine utilization protein EutQ (cupin superfamily)
MSTTASRVKVLRESEAKFEDLVPGREVSQSIDEAGISDLGGGFFRQTTPDAEFTGLIRGDEILYVVEGELEVETEDEKVVATTGEAILIAKNTTATFRGKLGTRTFWAIHPALY